MKGFYLDVSTVLLLTSRMTFRLADSSPFVLKTRRLFWSVSVVSVTDSSVRVVALSSNLSLFGMIDLSVSDEIVSCFFELSKLALAACSLLSHLRFRCTFGTELSFPLLDVVVVAVSSSVLVESSSVCCLVTSNQNMESIFDFFSFFRKDVNLYL